jgi:hypothetical protein
MAIRSQPFWEFDVCVFQHPTKALLEFEKTIFFYASISSNSSDNTEIERFFALGFGER